VSEAVDAVAKTEPIRVLAAVIRRGERLLLCRRPAHKRHGGLWEFPGVKLEPGESLLEAARREMQEELGATALSVDETLYVCSDPGSIFMIEFVRVEIHGEPRALEHDEARWVTLAELDGLQLAPADAAFVNWLRTRPVPAARICKRPSACGRGATGAQVVPPLPAGSRQTKRKIKLVNLREWPNVSASRIGSSMRRRGVSSGSGTARWARRRHR
jgi:8-oxo-dGTP diphosphatase